MHVALASLAIDEAANVRKTGRGSETAFVASIRAKGVIEPLTVRRAGENYTVVNGGKRLAALEWMAARGESAAGVPVDDNYPVPVTVRDEDDAEARDTSLITNIVRAGMHPVDEFEAFAAMVDGGMAVADVAARYALEEKQIRQRLALGQLAPRIRAAWRAGEIGADHAKAFTLGADHADQERIFEKLQKNGEIRWGAHTIQQAFVGKQGDVGKLVTFVGAEDLRRAGVDLREDLFGTAHTVPDPKVVKKLADEKLAAECARLIAAGWGWAMTEADLPQGARWSWSGLTAKRAKPTKAEAKRLKELEAIAEDDDAFDAAVEERGAIDAAIDARSWSAEHKARSGCIVSIGHRGELDVKVGVLKPEEARKEKARERAKERVKTKGDGPSAAEPAGPDISNALARDLSVSMTLAVREALADERHVGLAALLAGFLSAEPYADPVRVRHEGLGHKVYRTDAEAYATIFDRFKAMTVDQLLAVAAGIAGEAVSLERHDAAKPPMATAGVAALVNAIDPDALELALDNHFDPEDFFKRASARVALVAIGEMGLDKGKASKKPDLVAIAAAGARQKGWLPVQMRTAHYAGPGAKWTPAALDREPAAIGGGEEEEDDDA